LLSGRSRQQNQRLALLNDEPVGDAEQDVLGARETAARLSALLRASHRSTPFTLAIDAGWGMGKSSLMRLVDIGLRDRRPQIRTVWYNAWTASGSDALEGLIKSVLISLDPNVLRRGLRNLSQHGRLVRALRTVLMAVAGLLHAAGPINELWDRMSVDARTRNQMRDVMRDLVTDWVDGAAPGAGGRMLVVFIDDLDRCSEETVMAVCEALKLYLDVPGIAFVIGCDWAALGPNGLLRDAPPTVAAFLEKIFQTSYRVPIAGDEGIEAYVRHCAATAGIGAFLDEDLTRLLIERSERNPRRIKRLVNGFVLEASLNPVWRDFTAEAVVRVLLLQYFYSDFSRLMTIPAAAGARDVVAEFRGYRRLRQLLWTGGPLTEEQRASVLEALRSYDLPVADVQYDASTLRELERQLPLQFPQLAADRGFVSLVEELMALDEADELVRRLRHAVPRRPPVAPAAPVAPRQGYGETYGAAMPPQPVSPRQEYGEPSPFTPDNRHPQQPAQPAPGPSFPQPEAAERDTGPDTEQDFERDFDPLLGQDFDQDVEDTDEDTDEDSGAVSRRIPDARPAPPPPATGYSGPPASPVSPDPYSGNGPADSAQGHGQVFAVQRGDPYVSPGVPSTVYAGLRLLWVTQNPGDAWQFTAQLNSKGALVRLADTFGHAQLVFKERKPNLLVVDIDWELERGAGFMYVERLRENEGFTGQVIFFDPWASPAHVERASELDAVGVAKSMEEVMGFIDSVAPELIQQARANQGSPRP